jgi:DNA-binding MarR family transcriptional regulator/GNAT superfamily N-acetyltransferase
MDRGQVDRVRQFSRTVTQRVGALEDRFLARDRSIGQSRLLWEIGAGGAGQHSTAGGAGQHSTAGGAGRHSTAGVAEVRSLRARLDLDSGYLSRLLRSLEADGLVKVGAAGGDRRVRTVRLTAAGRAERAELDRRSDDVAESILAPLTDGQRQRLVAAMADVERLLVASMVRVAVVDPRHPHARHGFREYFAELGHRFDDGFDPDRSISAADDELRAPAGLLIVATLHDEPVGCGALKLHPGAPAEVKRMWVSPDIRGLGLGRRLLAELEARASAHGVTTLRLETNRTLAEAIALYRSAGYREVAAFNDEPYAHHWFEKRIRSARPPADERRRLHRT